VKQPKQKFDSQCEKFLQNRKDPQKCGKKEKRSQLVKKVIEGVIGVIKRGLVKGRVWGGGKKRDRRERTKLGCQKHKV